MKQIYNILFYMKQMLKILFYMKQMLKYRFFYHIFCCNTFVFACPIIARSHSNIRIGPQTFVFAPEFNFRYLRSGLEENMSKYKERWCIKSYFNQTNTF
jgi:hypothetical protein